MTAASSGGVSFYGAAEADLAGAIEASPTLKSEGHMRHESGLASRLVRAKSPF